MSVTSPTIETFAPTPAVTTRAGSAIHAQLLRITSNSTDSEQVRSQLRKLVTDVSSSTFVAHLFADGDGRLVLAESNWEGQVPVGVDREQITETATFAANRNATQIKTSDDNSQQIVCVPIEPAGSRAEVLAAALPGSGAGLQSALHLLELTVAYQRLWSKGSFSAANQWKLNSLAAIVDLVTQIESQESYQAAANVTTNEVAKYVGCARVAFAQMTPSGLRLRDISGLDVFDANSDTSRAFREALAESLLHSDLVTWPVDDEHRRSALLAHKSLARICHFKSICTTRLMTPDGEIVGAWLFGDNDDVVTGERFQNFVRAASPRIASALNIARARHESIARRAVSSINKFIRKRNSAIVLVAVIFVIGLLLMPIPYRIRCRCSVEPDSRRYAVAPFNGIVEEAFVEPGDVVAAGSLLAKMDGREIRWELSAAEAERAQAAKQREVELSERNVTKVLIAQLETERLDARIDVLRYRRQHLELKSNIDGVVLSSTLEKSQSAPVDVGQELFEIGPLDNLKVEIEVPDTEIAQIDVGQQVKIWIDGFEDTPFEAAIERIVPRSELRNDQNVFIARVTLPNSNKKYRPGMHGSVRITGPHRPLGWNLFHRPWDSIKSRMTWW